MNSFKLLTKAFGLFLLLGLFFSWKVEAQVPAIAVTAPTPPLVLDAMGCPMESASQAGVAAPAATSVFNDEEIEFVEAVCLKIKYPSIPGMPPVTVFANRIHNRGDRIEITAWNNPGSQDDLVFTLPPNAVLTIPQDAALGRTYFGPAWSLHYYATVAHASEIVAFTSEWRPDSMIPSPPQMIGNVWATLWGIRAQHAAQNHEAGLQFPTKDSAH